MVVRLSDLLAPICWPAANVILATIWGKGNQSAAGLQDILKSLRIFTCENSVPGARHDAEVSS